MNSKSLVSNINTPSSNTNHGNVAKEKGEKAKEKRVSKTDDGMKMEITFNYRTAPTHEFITEIIDN